MSDLRVPGLEGQCVLVTGASSGIGRQMALRFAQNGARVGLHYQMPLADFGARVARLPLGRAVQPDEVAQMGVYLASSAANAITGQTFSVTAGD